MQPAPSAVYHYNDTIAEIPPHNRVNAIFQAAKKDLLQVIQLQVPRASENLANVNDFLSLFVLYYNAHQYGEFKMIPSLSLTWVHYF